MTVDVPSLPTKVKERRLDAEMYSETSSHFHNYTTPTKGKALPIMHGPGPGPAYRDHSLQTDLPHSMSPCTMSLYEQEQSDSQKALVSPLSDKSFGYSEPGHGPMEEMLDVKPELDQLEGLFDLGNSLALEDSLLESSRGDILWSPPADKFKVEDVFQCDQNQVNCGPTLAQLNSPAQIAAMFNVEKKVAPAATATVSSPATASAAWSLPQQPLPAYLPSQPPAYTNVSSLPCSTQPSHVTPQATLNFTNCSFNSAKFSALPTAGPQVAATVVAPPAAPWQDVPQQTTLATGYQGYINIEPCNQSLKQPYPSLQPASDVVVPKAGYTDLKRPYTGTKRPFPGNRRLFPGEHADGSDMDSKWEDIKQFMHSDLAATTNRAAATATSTAAATATSKPALQVEVKQEKDVAYTPNDIEDDSNDEDDYMSESEESDAENKGNFIEFSSDAESVDSISHLMPDCASRRKKGKRYFWQYNMQAKGPKGKRLCTTLEQRDPHVLDDFTDPVFDPKQSDMRYKHSGKARRGEGNDVTPNPKRLFQIGNELNMLNRQIHDLTPVSEMPSMSKPKSRREKNKLASRACRLKKKAQHEANKVKLHGLEKEHYELMGLLGKARSMMKARVQEPDKYGSVSMAAQLAVLEKKCWTFRICGKTAEFVNTVVDKVAAGDNTGGLKR